MTRTMAIERIRNIGIIAHIDAGKTTVTERILLVSGLIHKPGEVHDGTATMDFDVQERKRGITINAAATTVSWRDHRITIIDTPGHVDFTAEVERSLRVLDGGIAVFDAVAGVEPQSETVWQQADKYAVPRICFVNKMDRIGADFARTVQMIYDRLGVRGVPVQVPIGVEHDFRGVVDLLAERALLFGNDGEPQDAPIPAALTAQVTAQRQALIEAVAETDDEVLAAYLAGHTLDVLTVQQALRRAVLAGRLVPVLCGAALRNKGIHALLDAVVAYLPSPTDAGALRGTAPDDEATELTRARLPNAPLAALVFKLVSDPHVGQLAYIRIYAGTLTNGSYVLNATRNVRERISRMLLMHADQATGIEQASAGDIVALVGPKHSVTGDTLCDAAHPIVLESIQFPQPVVRVAVEPRTAADRERLGPALRKLRAADPTLEVSTDVETGQTILAGMGELHLEVQLERLRLEHHVETRHGKPQVAYRETIGSVAELEHTLARQSGGGSGQWARVRLRVEPLARGHGFMFVDAVVGGEVPHLFIPAVAAGVRAALSSGVVAGYPVVDVQVTLVGGAFHPVDSSELAFNLAAAQALRLALHNAQPYLLEPVMHVEVVTPDTFVGAVLGDVGGRRGAVLSMEARGIVQVVRARVPLAELWGYTSAVRSLTQGRASATIDRAVYEALPALLAAAVRKRAIG